MVQSYGTQICVALDTINSINYTKKIDAQLSLPKAKAFQLFHVLSIQVHLYVLLSLPKAKALQQFHVLLFDTQNAKMKAVISAKQHLQFQRTSRRSLYFVFLQKGLLITDGQTLQFFIFLTDLPKRKTPMSLTMILPRSLLYTKLLLGLLYWGPTFHQPNSFPQTETLDQN